MTTESKHQELEGVVQSSKGDKTITVRVPHIVQHPKYKKFLRKERVFRVHDEKNEAKEGDRVVISESRPISRTKCWRLKEVVERAKTV
jgi:small subunit ribosomal protein S17